MIERKVFDLFAKSLQMGSDKHSLVAWDGLMRSGSLKVGDKFILLPTTEALKSAKDGGFAHIIVASCHTTPRLARIFSKQICRWGRVTKDADAVDLTADSEVATFATDRGFADLCTVGKDDATKRCIEVAEFVDYVRQVYKDGEPTDKWEAKKQPIFKWAEIDEDKYLSVVEAFLQ